MAKHIETEKNDYSDVHRLESIAGNSYFFEIAERKVRNDAVIMRYLIIIRLIDREIQRTMEAIEHFERTRNIPGSEKCITYWEGYRDMALRCKKFMEEIVEKEKGDEE